MPRIPDDAVAEVKDAIYEVACDLVNDGTAEKYSGLDSELALQLLAYVNKISRTAYEHIVAAYPACPTNFLDIYDLLDDLYYDAKNCTMLETLRVVVLEGLPPNAKTALARLEMLIDSVIK